MASPSVIRAPFMASGPLPRFLVLGALLALPTAPTAADEPPESVEAAGRYALAREAAEGGRTDEALDLLGEALAGGTSNETPRLDPAWSDLLTDPRFRRLLDAHTGNPSARLTSEDEPGEPLRVLGLVQDPEGNPIEGAVVFAHQADATGLYNREGGPDPRLFGSVRTGPDGTFELTTIRPASYPGSRIPQHIHLRARATGHRERVFELLFADDPFRSGSSRRDVVGQPSPPGEDGFRTVECPVVLQPATP